MSFLPAAKALLSSMKPGKPRYEILCYLINNAVGSLNAKSWDEIENHLKSKKLSCRKQTFQQGLLKDSREGESFIGSNDHGAQRGYFIIDSKLDAELMKNWYLNRIKTEKQRVDNLVKQAWKVGFHI